MRPEFQNLFAVVKEFAAGSPQAERLRLPSLRETWTLISLVRQRTRHRWAASAMPRGRLTPGEGVMPGLPEWKYSYHGAGCRLANRVTGESIETETGEAIDFFFWVNHLQSWRTPDPATRRMIELHPSLESLGVTVAGLAEAGTVKRSGSRITLAAETLEHTEVVGRLIDLFKEEAKLTAFYGHIGDSDDPTVADPVWRRRLATAVRWLETDALGREALYDLEDLDPAVGRIRLMATLLRRPHTALNAAALEVIARRKDPQWLEPVLKLWRDIEPGAEAPQSWLWIQCADFMLRHSFHLDEVLLALPRAGPSVAVEAALLALEFGADVA